jgi:TRAP transporter TAXI family solute receptor
LLDLGRIEAGTVASNALYPSWYGQKPYEKQYRGARIAMWVFPNPTVFFALADKKITKIRDLKGKRVGVGAGPSTWDHLTGPFLEAHGIDYQKDIKRVYGSFEDLCNQVRDGLLDASIGNISAGINLMPAISALAAEKKLVFLEWDPQAIESIPAKIPYFMKAVVSAAALPGRQTDYVTLDLGAMLLVVRHDLPEDFIYKMTKTIHENLPELAKTTKLFKYAADNPKFMTQRLGDIEFHRGSVRYWKEVRLW